MRIGYRVSQFWNAIRARPDPDLLKKAAEVLSPDLMKLFLKLQPSEQAHSLKIFERLVSQGEDNQDLLAAALLHDIGKTRYPLRLWERILYVLAKPLIPQKIDTWGRANPTGMKRLFVVAAQHPDWGADLAAQAGASELTVKLIRYHQDKPDSRSGQSLPDQRERLFLTRLMLLDEEN